MSTRRAARADLRLRGQVTRWVADRGFGFIREDDTGSDLFVHLSQLPNGMTALEPGTEVRFETEPAWIPGQCDRAVRVTFAADPPDSE
jgi:cold shock CspA family protein